jgi:hypothetical protein
MAVAALFGGYRAVTRVLWLLLAYNFMCVFFFAAMYSAIDFNAHFVVPAGVRADASTRLYYAFATQSTQMAGEIYPKTALARGLVSFQILSAYVVTLALVVPWIHAVSRPAIGHPH